MSHLCSQLSRGSHLNLDLTLALRPYLVSHYFSALTPYRSFPAPLPPPLATCGSLDMTSHTHASGLLHLLFPLSGKHFSQISPWLDSSRLSDLGLKYHFFRGLPWSPHTQQQSLTVYHLTLLLFFWAHTPLVDITYLFVCWYLLTHLFLCFYPLEYNPWEQGFSLLYLMLYT